MLTFLTAVGKFFIEFAKTLVIDTVIHAMLHPYNEIKKNVLGGNFACL